VCSSDLGDEVAPDMGAGAADLGRAKR
jgi:hypothetical protein